MIAAASYSSLYKHYSYNIDVRKHDPFICLSEIDCSPEFKNLTEDILNRISLNENWIYKPGDKKRKAIEAYLFSLMALPSSGISAWLRTPLSVSYFTGREIGYKPFISIHKALLNIGYTIEQKGFYPRDETQNIGLVTRVRPTPELLEHIARYQLDIADYQQHCRPLRHSICKSLGPVIVRAAKSGDWLNPKRGKRIKIDLESDQVRQNVERVQRLDDWFSGVDITGCTHHGFYRLFNLGDHSKFAFDKGGRLYLYGNYQLIKRKMRSRIRINGSPVVEVDISASHITIYHALMNLPLISTTNLYDIPGIPEFVVKKFIVTTLGNGRFQRRWPQSFADEYERDHYYKLHETYPIKIVREAVLAKLPALKLLPESGISWADLQYTESVGLFAAVEELAYKYGIPGLPLHDAVIVPKDKADQAAKVMQDCFKKHLNIAISVKIKSATS